LLFLPQCSAHKKPLFAGIVTLLGFSIHEALFNVSSKNINKAKFILM
jgi:hypothetical protein